MCLPKTLVKPQNVHKKNKSKKHDSSNDSLARPKKTLSNETLQAAACTSRNGRLLAKAQTVLCRYAQKLKEDQFNEPLVFSDLATFHTTGKVNKLNVCIWSKENFHATIEHERESQKVNVFCAFFHNHIHSQFFLGGKCY